MEYEELVVARRRALVPVFAAVCAAFCIEMAIFYFVDWTPSRSALVGFVAAVNTVCVTVAQVWARRRNKGRRTAP